MWGKVGENPAALRAAVFSLSSKNLRGGGRSNAPPPAGRGLTLLVAGGLFLSTPRVFLEYLPNGLS